MRSLRSNKNIILFILTLMMFFTYSLKAATDTPKTLKVCADPNYMPFSHKDKTGYENEIAELIGKQLNIPVEYMWFPQRLGFIRNTLRKESEQGDGSHLCDLVMGVPNNYGMAMTTKPYLTSTYALVILNDGKLKDLEKGNDLVQLPLSELSGLTIAITERSPGALWLSKYSLFEQMSPYIAQNGDPNVFPGEPMLRDLLAKKIDAAIVWGPTAGYFSRENDNVRVLPLETVPGVRFDYSISAAVRYGEKDWRNQIQDILDSNSAQINYILTKARIPLLAIKNEEEKDDDDDEKEKNTNVDKEKVVSKENESKTSEQKASTSKATAVKTSTDFDAANSYQSHVQCTDGKDCKIDKFLLKGFRAFSQCQVCHGIDGNGSTIAPSLLSKLDSDITYEIFVDRVANGFTGQMGVMPPWKDNPNVMKNMNNLYAYLKARADGVIPAGRLKKFKK